MSKNVLQFLLISAHGRIPCDLVSKYRVWADESDEYNISRASHQPVLGEIFHIICRFIKSEFWGGWPINYQMRSHYKLSQILADRLRKQCVYQDIKMSAAILNVFIFEKSLCHPIIQTS